MAHHSKANRQQVWTEAKQGHFCNTKGMVLIGQRRHCMLETSRLL